MTAAPPSIIVSTSRTGTTTPTSLTSSTLTSSTLTSSTLTSSTLTSSTLTSRPVQLSRNFRAMATSVALRIVTAPTAALPPTAAVHPTSALPPTGDPKVLAGGAAAALQRAEQVFHRVEAACTRFDDGSPLMRVNATPDAWHVVPRELFDAVAEAHAAYTQTDGLFDPRVLRTLQSWGYDRSVPFEDGPVSLAAPAMSGPAPETPAPRRRSWQPRLDHDRCAIWLGPDPIDLGGIGKGLAVRWAAAELARTASAGSSSLIEAGGDIYASGAGPEGTGWLIDVEDPRGGPEPLAVLRLQDAACATSSVRIRRWQVGGRDVHHLVDPRTGEPGGAGLLAVTVIDTDPARAEVWTKALFLTGRDQLRRRADEAAEPGVAALFVDEDGGVGVNRAMRDHLVWQATRG